MQRKIDKRNVYNAGKGKTDEDLVHLHMSNHYRRILNAKKAVDNSPPYCYKARRPSASKPPGTKNKPNRPFDSLPLTDRSLSTNSNKDSCWGAESYAGSSRYHARCLLEGPAYEPSVKRTFGNGMDLVDRITYDTKNGPAAYREEAWAQGKGQQSDKRCEPGFDARRNGNEGESSANAKRRLPATASCETAQKRKFTVQKKLKASGVTVKGTKSFPSLEGKICPRTFKADAASKLRSLRVYHPPRRKPSRSKAETPPDALEAPDCKCTKICVCDSSETVLKKTSFNPKEQSLTSSRDSAYNGGASSLPESRSPTPDQRRKKECRCCCCCRCCEKKQGPESSEAAAAGTVGSSEAPPPAASPPAPAPEPRDQESFEKMQEDALYVKFIQDITTEILDKNLYTNKALKKVMKKHIKSNLRNLRKDRMLLEVENLRIQLGIPEDKTLLELEEEGGIRHASKFYPVISDSAFVMPKVADEEVCPPGRESPREIARSKSVVLSSPLQEEKPVSGSETEDGGEVISVTQVKKSVREKAAVAASRPNSSDDSDRPSDPKKRSVLKNRRQKHARTYSSSSSDSESSGTFSRPIREKASREVSTSEEPYLGDFGQKSLLLDKKNRTVSFWKTPDGNLARSFEAKQKKAAAPAEEPRDKPKSD